jgi:hypothetical protein
MKSIVEKIPKVFPKEQFPLFISFLIAVRLQTITCPGDQLHVLVTLNGIDPNYILLGDSSCQPLWSNETHAQFVTHVDNCSLVWK